MNKLTLVTPAMNIFVGGVILGLGIAQFAMEHYLWAGLDIFLCVASLVLAKKPLSY